MKKSYLISLFMCLGLLMQQACPVFEFANRTSTVRLNSGSDLTICTAISNWDGTFNQQGIVTGAPITFTSGILEYLDTPVFFTGVFDGDAAQQITLNGNDRCRIESGKFNKRLVVSGTNNDLEGQGLFEDDSQGSPNITLTDANTQLNISMQSALNSYIAMNGGTITLCDNLYFTDLRTFLGTGSVNCNNRKVSLSGADFNLTSTLLWGDGSIELHSETALSGRWVFGAPTGVINGHCNVLDLQQTGNLWIKSGTTLHLTDVVLKNLGSGQILFQDNTSKLVLSNVEIELNNNYTFTNGNVIVNGATSVFTANYLMTFNQNSVLTIDGQTLWYDTGDFLDNNNITLGGLSNVAYFNNGNISNVCCGGNLVVQNSNAIVNITNEINNLENCCDLTVQNSNAIVAEKKEIKNNSNAIVNLNLVNIINNSLLIQNSNSIVNIQNEIDDLENCCDLTVQNSNAIVAEKKEIKNNSNAIVNLNLVNVINNSLLIQNSNSIVNIQNEIDDLEDCCDLTVQNSNAIVNLNLANVINNSLLIQNSNSIVNIQNEIDDLEDCCDLTVQNSNAIVNLNLANVINNSLLIQNSNSIVNIQNEIDDLENCCDLTVQNSNAIVAEKKEIKNNSNAIVNLNLVNVINNSLLIQNSNSIVNIQNEIDDLEDCCDLTVQNSNAIVNLNLANVINNSLLIQNSNSIVFIQNEIDDLENCCDLTVQNSNAIVAEKKEIKNNSNAIVNINNHFIITNSLVIQNSNAIVNIQNEIDDLEDCCDLTVQNSNSIVFIQNEIDDLEDCCDLTQQNSNAIVAEKKEIKNNSNAIVNINNHFIITNSLVIQNSNAIVNIQNEIDDLEDCCDLTVQNSNSIVFIQNEIDDLEDCCDLTQQNSNAIVSLTYEVNNNSNAVVNINNNLVINTSLLIQTSNAVNNCCGNIIPPNPCASRFIQPTEVLTYPVDTLIDCDGAIWVFSNPNNPQFVLDNNVTVTLQNITFSELHPGTFQFGTGSKLAIGENVVFELAGDLTFNTGQINVIGMSESPIVFNAVGEGCRRTITLVGAPGDVVMDLGVNTFAIAAIELVGTEHIHVDQVSTMSGLLAGSIGMMGCNTVNVPETTDISFLIERELNEIVVNNNNITFNGFFIWGDNTENTLGMTLRPPNRSTVVPTINFADDSIFLASTGGRASLIFEDHQVVLNTLGSNAFVIDNNAFLSGQTIILNGFPIKISSNNFTFDSSMNLQSDVPNAFAEDFIRSVAGRHRDKVVTAVHILRERQSAEEKALVALIETEVNKVVKPTVEQSSSSLGRTLMDGIPSTIPSAATLATDFANANETAGISKQNLTTGLFKFQYNLTTPTGFSQFGIDPTLGNRFRVFLRGNSILNQGAFSADGVAATLDYKTVQAITTLKEDVDSTLNDYISIEGTNNRIVVLTQFVVDGDLIFDDNSELIFEFDDRLSDQLTGIDCTTDTPFGVPQNPVVFINSNIILPASSRLVFKGNGTVVFADDVVITFSDQGTTLVGAGQRPTLLFTDGAMAQLAANAGLRFTGQGKVVVDHGAMFVIGSDQQVTVGLDPADNIDWSIERNGKVDVTSTNNDKAKFSFQQGQYGMSIKQEGQLHIGSNGLVEFGSFADPNADPRVAQGYLKKFEAICCGKVIIESACGTPGTLQFLPNILSDPNDSETEQTTYLNIGSCDLRGRGRVCFVGLPADGSGNFCGVFQPDIFAANVCNKTVCGNGCRKPIDIVSCFINKNPALCCATVFDTVDSQGNSIQQIRFCNGTISCPLLPGDIITGEDANGNVFGINKGRLFVLHPSCTNCGEIRE